MHGYDINGMPSMQQQVPPPQQMGNPMLEGMTNHPDSADSYVTYLDGSDDSITGSP